MAVERTLGIIKPDSLEKGIIGDICKKIEDANLKVVGMKMMQLDAERAGGFYAVHKDKPFYDSLIAFMTSGLVFRSFLRAKMRLLNGAIQWARPILKKRQKERFAMTLERTSSAMLCTVQMLLRQQRLRLHTSSRRVISYPMSGCNPN